MIDFEKKGWQPKMGEAVYLNHAITNGKWARAIVNGWKGDCLYVTTDKYDRCRIHARHAGMKPIITIKEQQASSQTTNTG
jgi:hypothetical protein